MDTFLIGALDGLKWRKTVIFLGTVGVTKTLGVKVNGRRAVLSITSITN